MSHRRLACIALGFCVFTSGALAADASLIDDFDQPPSLWQASKTVRLSRLEVPPSSPLARPGQTTAEGVLNIDGPRHFDVRWPSGQFCHQGGHLDGNREITLSILTTPSFDASTVQYRSARFGGAVELHEDKSRIPASHLQDSDGDGDLDLPVHFRCGDIANLNYQQLPKLEALTRDNSFITTGDATGTLFRPIQGGQDWSVGEGLRFWFHGTGRGDVIRFQLHDNRAPD